VVIRTVLPASRSGVVVSSGLAAFVAPVLAAIAFTLEYAIGGNDVASVATVGWAMIGVHALVGIGEGVITALTVGVVLGVRPDLVYGAQDLQAPLTLGTRPGPAAGEVR
jgi:cobalt/nickel transport system permease protein